MASPGVVRSSYSINSTLALPLFSFMPPRALTCSTQSFTFGQKVTVDPPARGPVFGADAPILIVSADTAETDAIIAIDATPAITRFLYFRISIEVSPLVK